MSFWKQHAEFTLLDTYQNGSVTELCRVIFMSAMDKKNLVKTYTPKKTLANTIEDLTGKPLRRIQESIKELNDEGFGILLSKNSFQVNPAFATKDRLKPKYSGNNCQYSDEAWEFLARYNSTFSDGPQYTKPKDDEMMKQMKAELLEIKNQNTEMMQLLRSIAKGMNPQEAQEKAECHLKLIEGGKEA